MSARRPTLFQNSGTITAVTAAVVYAHPAEVTAIRVSSKNAAVTYFQLHSKVTIPLATEVPVMWFNLPAGTATAPATLELDERWFNDNVLCDPGMGWAFSTTPTTYTAATVAADHDVTILYRGA